MTNEITLTPQELEDIKDTIKFRECVMIKLKRLNGLPERVTKAETKLYVLMWGIPIIIASFLAIKVAIAR